MDDCVRDATAAPLSLLVQCLFFFLHPFQSAMPCHHHHCSLTAKCTAEFPSLPLKHFMPEPPLTLLLLQWHSIRSPQCAVALSHKSHQSPDICYICAVVVFPSSCLQVRPCCWHWQRACAVVWRLSNHLRLFGGQQPVVQRPRA